MRGCCVVAGCCWMVAVWLLDEFGRKEGAAPFHTNYSDRSNHSEGYGAPSLLLTLPASNHSPAR